MTDQKQTECAAQTKQDEALLCRRMIGIIDQSGALIEKGRSRLLEGDAMLLHIDRSLVIVPLESKRSELMATV